MRKFFLVWPIVTFFLATVSPVEAQQQAKVPKIGFRRSPSRSILRAAVPAQISVNSAMLRAKT